MNEQLLKLAEKHQFVHEHMSPGEKADAIRKFQDIAEVIIKECVEKQLLLAEIFEKGLDDFEPAFPEFVEGTISGLKEGAEHIKHCFGVE